MKKHQWLKLHSKRTQPYTVDDISVIIPSAAGIFENRWKWFWPQYIAKTHPKVVKNTWIVCDSEEKDFLKEVTNHDRIITAEPRWIAVKTLEGMDRIRTRLTFRLANDIMVVRKGWEVPLLKRFNDITKLQLIAKVTHGVTYPDSQHRMEKDWKFIKKEYKGMDTTAAVYPHGAILMAQTAVWRAYYSYITDYTLHDHDEIFFSQIARGDGMIFTNMTGIDAYLAHVGITNQDFKEHRLQEIRELRKRYEKLPDNPGYKICE